MLSTGTNTWRRNMRSGLIAVIGILGLVGCGKDDEPRAPADAIPAATDAISGSVTIGAVGTRNTASVVVSPVKLSRAPILVHDYRRCVESGACTPPTRSDSACSSSGLDGRTWTPSPERREWIPLTCATPDQASRYCRWVGGRLPRLEEWELAARGADVHRYAWGDRAPTCDDVLRLRFRSNDPAASCGSSPLGDDMAVGKHPSGRGNGVLDDVLVTRGEYVSPPKVDVPGSCTGKACVVRGASPGAIEQVIPAGSPVDLEAAGFRCAWEVE